jgi:glycosyltransferase involved in cell wall biosynthesis
VGRLSPEKGLLSLIRAVHELQQTATGKRLRLWFAGIGPEEQALDREIKRKGVRAEFLGFLEGPKLMQAYASADIFVLPSVSEPWGLVVNEAMQFGLPVIVSDRVGCGPVLVQHGVNGYVVPAGDVGALALALRQMADDPVLRESMGHKSRQIIEGHKIGDWCKKVVEAIKRDLGARLPQ